MALSQSVTPAYEQYFNFDTELQPEAQSSESGPSPYIQHGDLANVYSNYSGAFYTSAGFLHPTSTSTAFASNDTPLTNGHGIEYYSWGPQQYHSHQSPTSLPQEQDFVNPLETRTDDEPTEIKTTTSSPIHSPPSSNFILSSQQEPDIETKPDSKAKGTRNGSANAPMPKQSRKRNQRSRKKKPVDPNSIVEVAKRSKFLERNRVAASKCRQKKKEWATDLDTRARELQISRDSLTALTSSLKEEVLYLKSEMLKHSTCNCTQVRAYLQNQIGQMSGSSRRCSHCHHHQDDEYTSLSSADMTTDSLEESQQGSVANTPNTMSSAYSPDRDARSSSGGKLEALLSTGLTPDTSDHGINTRIGFHRS